MLGFLPLAIVHGAEPGPERPAATTDAANTVIPDDPFAVYPQIIDTVQPDPFVTANLRRARLAASPLVAHEYQFVVEAKDTQVILVPGQGTYVVLAPATRPPDRSGRSALVMVAQKIDLSKLFPPSVWEQPPER